MTEMGINRETLHQLARMAIGRADRGMPESMRIKVRDAAQRIADATAIPEDQPLILISSNTL